MGKRVVLVGNVASGKTTLAREICRRAGFKPYWESPEGRPYQSDLRLRRERWALANQLDFMLYRAGQERDILRWDVVGVQDGGLDQDFWVFTRYFAALGHLDERAYALCEGAYDLLRGLLGRPEVVVRLVVPMAELARRRRERRRSGEEELVPMVDMGKLDGLLEDGIERGGIRPTLTVTWTSDGCWSRSEMRRVAEEVAAAVLV